MLNRKLLNLSTHLYNCHNHSNFRGMVMAIQISYTATEVSSSAEVFFL